MFAFALWDRRERRLSLVRDRFGEKPLYYGWVGGDFLFASELKAIRRHPRFDARDRPPRARLFTAAQLHSGAAVDLSRHLQARARLHARARPRGARRPLAEPPAVGSSGGGLLPRYWSYRDVLAAGLRRPDRQRGGGRRRARAGACRGGRRADRMADVPVGAFLSGGIDSSTDRRALPEIFEPAGADLHHRLRGRGFNEADHARAVARHFGTEHHEQIVTAREAQEVIPGFRRCTTSRSPIPRRSRPIWSARSRASR